MSPHTQKLQELGLSEKEASVYLAALSLGESTMQTIAERSGIKRATTYLAVESLIHRGLMSSLEKGKKTFFVAESPENLMRIIETREREAQEQKRVLPDIISQLSVLYTGNGEKPAVRFYEGTEGLETIRRDFINPQYTEVFSWTNYDLLAEIFSRDNSVGKERVRRKIKAKLLYTRKAGPLDPQWANNPAEFRESRYVPTDKYPFEGDITIYGNRVAISSFKGKPNSVLIDHPVVAQMMKSFFLLAWESAQQ